MTLLVQRFLMLALTAFWVPSAGASWAYCQRFGMVHPAGTACGHAAQNVDQRCNCCGGEEPEPPIEDDCCIAAGKMLPEALLPVTGNPVPTIPVAPESGAMGPLELPIQPANCWFPAWHLRGPPPDRAVFLRLRSLRL